MRIALRLLIYANDARGRKIVLAEMMRCFKYEAEMYNTNVCVCELM